MKKIAIISHYHPSFVVGGAQNIAFNLFTEIRKFGYDATFIAGKDKNSEIKFPEPITYIDSDGKEILVRTRCNHFQVTGVGHQVAWEYLEKLLNKINPDVIHIQHFYNWGIEIIEKIRKWRHDIPLAVTFHEFIPICNNIGLMIKTDGACLCRQASTIDCHDCFPDIPQTDFEYHDKIIKRILDKSDIYIAPSQFLMERYIQWGLNEKKFVKIPNGISLETAMEINDNPNTLNHKKFGYFGQIAIHKGLDILLKALDYIPKNLLGPAGISLCIHAANLPEQPCEFLDPNLKRILPISYQKEIFDLLERWKSVVSFHGPYDKSNLNIKMNSVDWVIVPSKCWENQPLTIQEAFFNRKPVITGNVGGMAESVKDGIDGLLFEVGSAHDLAKTLIKAAETKTLWEKLRDGIKKPNSSREMALRHIEIYNAL